MPKPVAKPVIIKPFTIKPITMWSKSSRPGIPPPFAGLTRTPALSRIRFDGLAVPLNPDLYCRTPH
jgi:hypothetical protein